MAAKLTGQLTAQEFVDLSVLLNRFKAFNLDEPYDSISSRQLINQADQLVNLKYQKYILNGGE